MFGLPDIRPVYLDYAATTPVATEAAAAMAAVLAPDGPFGNASSALHAYGRRAAAVVEAARADVAAAIGAVSGEVVFCSGATEADNLAILGAARYRRDRGRHVVTSRTEHKAVLDSFRELEAEGFDVTWLLPDATGRVSPAQLAGALRDDTTLVSLMWVNNEIGAINDIAALGGVARERGVLFHVDAAQALGKLPVDVSSLPVDLVSLSAHKCYGPKGVGALWLSPREGVHIEPVSYGGGQERGLRPGTLPTHQVAGFGAAARLVSERLDADRARAAELGGALLSRLTAVPGVTLNGDRDARVPHIVNVSVAGVEGESLVLAMQPVALSTGSACTSLSAEPSFVLRALGRPDQLAQSSLRFSLGRGTTAEDVALAAGRFEAAVGRLREIAGPAGEAAA